MDIDATRGQTGGMHPSKQPGPRMAEAVTDLRKREIILQAIRRIARKQPKWSLTRIALVLVYGRRIGGLTPLNRSRRR